ncbi:MAG: hypothetical protein OXC91_15370 [Rhodobacteraceae bacterium]|nr:hypothetical protein [Paracoccaceae bacterium]
MLPLGEVFVEDEGKGVIAELIGIHLAAKSVCDLPELLFQMFPFFFKHKLISMV